MRGIFWCIAILSGLCVVGLAVPQAESLCFSFALAICILVAFLLYMRQRRARMQAENLHERITSYLAYGSPLDFSVEDSTLSILENDIAELAHRLLLEKDKSRAEHERGNAFLADISHQLKTPLASLRLGCEMRQRREGDSHALNRELAQLTRMEELVSSLLRLERLRAGAYKMRFEERFLRPFFEELIADMAEEQPKKTLVLHCPESTLRIDAYWLAEAIRNVLANACRHTEDGAAVTLTCEATEHLVTICVQDEGGGVDPSALPHLFTRFYTASGETAGVGLGLSIARQIIHAHHGSIRAYNQGPGLCMEISIPIIGGRLTI